MSDMAISPLSVPVGRASTAAGQSQSPAEKTAAPKTDVIDLSKPPTPEQAERLRNAGILGYGSVSATKTVTTTAREDGSTVTHFVMDYQHEYFDVVNEATYRSSSTGIGIFTMDGSTAQGVTAQVSFSSLSYWPGQVEKTVGQLAAAHQAKVSYLNLNFQGEELSGQLAHLEESYQSAKDKTADSFTGLLCRFLEPKDRVSFEGDIRSSVQAAFTRYEAKYSAVAASQEDGSWLGATLYKSAFHLQLCGGTSYTPPKLNGDGSRDLAKWENHVAVNISTYHSILNVAQTEDGQQQLFRFEAASMKVQASIAQGAISGRAADLLHLSGKNVRQQLLSLIGKNPSQQKKDGFHTTA